MLKEFDSITAPIQDLLNCSFQDNLHSFIWAQLNKYGKDFDIWDKAIEKAINTKAKTSC